MHELTETEKAVLKQLHDGVIRPLWPVAQRAGLALEVVERTVQGLAAKGLLEQRKSGKWKITFDGKAALGMVPGNETEIERAVARLADAEQDDVREITASQIQLLHGYYNLALDQARRSFRWALAASIVGLVFFLAAVGLVLVGHGMNAPVISIVSGAIVEMIAGVNFYLYGKTIGQLSIFHGRLETTQKFMLANSLCESLEDDLKGQTRALLIAKLAEAATPSAGEGNDSSPKR